MKESHFGEVLFVFYLVRLQGLSGHVPLHLSQVLIINQLLPQFIWRLTSCNFPPPDLGRLSGGNYGRAHVTKHITPFSSLPLSLALGFSPLSPHSPPPVFPQTVSGTLK